MEKLSVEHVERLVKIANTLDEMGLEEQANAIDGILKEAQITDWLAKAWQGGRAALRTKGGWNRILAGIVGWAAQDFANNITNSVISKADQKGESLGIEDIDDILKESVMGLFPKFVQNILGKVKGTLPQSGQGGGEGGSGMLGGVVQQVKGLIPGTQ